MINPLSKFKQVKINNITLYEVWMMDRTHFPPKLSKSVKMIVVDAPAIINNKSFYVDNQYFPTKEIALKHSKRYIKKYLINNIKRNKLEAKRFIKYVNTSVKLLNKYYR